MDDFLDFDLQTDNSLDNISSFDNYNTLSLDPIVSDPDKTITSIEFDKVLGSTPFNGFEGSLMYAISGSPYPNYEIAMVHYSDGTTQGVVVPSYFSITTALFALIGVYSIFRLIGAFFSNKAFW